MCPGSSHFPWARADRGGDDADPVFASNARVAVGGVACRVQAAGAFEQADASAEQVVGVVQSRACGPLVCFAGAG